MNGRHRSQVGRTSIVRGTKVACTLWDTRRKRRAASEAAYLASIVGRAHAFEYGW